MPRPALATGTLTFDANGQLDTTLATNPVVTTPVQLPGSAGSANGGQIATDPRFFQADDAEFRNQRNCHQPGWLDRRHRL